MNLDEFKKTLDTDARSKVKDLEAEISRLKEENASKRVYIEHLKEQLSERDNENNRLRERLKKFDLPKGVPFHLDMNNPNSLTTLAMLGEMFSK